MTAKIICPVCSERGSKSTVNTNGIMTTLMGYTGYHDEDGNFHHHDDNSRTTVGRCSNGHSFVYSYENSCWCGWKGRLEGYRVIDGEKEN